MVGTRTPSSTVRELHVAERTGNPPEDPYRPSQHAYQRWYHTQGRPWADAGGDFATGAAPDGWLVTNPGLFHPRSPGRTVMASLQSYVRTGVRGSFTNKLNNSMGCGAVMRAAPVALLGEDAFAFAAGTGLLTHSHPSGYLSAGALAHLVHLLLHDVELPDAIAKTRLKLTAWDGHEEQVEVLGGGWRGEQAFAIAVCTALVATDLADGCCWPSTTPTPPG